MIRRISSSASPTTTCRSFRRRRCERAPCNGRRQQRWGCRPTWACTTCWVLSSARLASASEFAESGTIRRSASETSLATSSVIIAFCVCVKQANFETSVLTSHSLKIRLASNMFFVFVFFLNYETNKTMRYSNSRKQIRKTRNGWGGLVNYL